VANSFPQLEGSGGSFEFDQCPESKKQTTRGVSGVGSRGEYDRIGAAIEIEKLGLGAL
jgi:hypothetical protein